jgi:hypothetical protein
MSKSIKLLLVLLPKYVGLLLVLLLLLMSSLRCASTNLITGEEETHYPLIDTRFKVHKYKDNIQWLIFPKNNKRTEYCSVHFVWEDIQPIYRPTGDGEYHWQYKVNKNKKNW